MSFYNVKKSMKRYKVLTQTIYLSLDLYKTSLISFAQNKKYDYHKKSLEIVVQKPYKTYEFVQRPIRSEQNLNQRPHKIKDAVKLVQSKYLEQNRSLRFNKRQENLSLRASSIMKAKKINGREIQRKKYLENKPIDLGLVIVIFIPLVCFLTLLTEFI